MLYEGATNNINIVNRAPAAGEKAVYTESPLDRERTGYAVISLTDNVQGTGRVLLVEGTGMGGVQSATDFLFNPDLMDSIIQQTGDNRHLSNFDLLLQTTFYTGGNLRAKAVALHVHPLAHK